jgi:hypothetical protein
LKQQGRVTITRRGWHQVLVSDQWVPAAPGECFAFFSDAGNLEALTPAFVRPRLHRIFAYRRDAIARLLG